MRRIHLGLIALLLAQLACNTLVPPRPQIEWNSSPEVLILQADTSGGMLYEPNAIPAARLWGAGRLVWVETDFNTGSRRVLEAHLTTAEMTTLLQKFVDAGFFGWQDHYSPGMVYDAPSSCVSVSLTDAYQSVCETLEGAPAKFDDLYGFVALAGVSGTEFIPTRGYLVAEAAPLNEATAIWPAETLGLSLSEAAGGVWIEGQALEMAWEQVNLNQLRPVVQEGDTAYSLTLLVPGLSRIEPPTP